MLTYIHAPTTLPYHDGGMRYADPVSYHRELAQQARLEELRRAEATLHAVIVEEEARRRRRRQSEERAAFERAVRRQAEERRRQEQQREEAEARMLAIAVARRAELARRAEVARREHQRQVQLERARQVALAQFARQQEQERRRRLEYVRQQDHQRRQLEARRQRVRQAEVTPALMQLVFDVFADQAPEVAAPAPASAPASAAAEAPAEKAPETITPAEASAPSAAPAVEAAPAAAPIEPLEDAAIVLQRRFRRHAARRSALDQLSQHASEFVSRRHAFAAPKELHFRDTPTSPPAIPQPQPSPLAFDKSNKGFLAYEEFLVSLLSKIDAVESHGDKAVQRARKELVRQVERELSRLDKLRQHEWERQSGASSAADSDAEEEDKTVRAAPTEDLPAEAGASTTSARSTESAVVPAAQEASIPDSTADAPAFKDAEPAAKTEATEQDLPASALQETPSAAIDTLATAPAEPPLIPASATSTALPAATSTSAEQSVDHAPEDEATSAPEPHDPADEEASSLGSGSDDEGIVPAVEEILKRARALGEQVEALERQERERGQQEETDAQEEEQEVDDSKASAAVEATSAEGLGDVLAETAPAEESALASESKESVTDESSASAEGADSASGQAIPEHPNKQEYVDSGSQSLPGTEAERKVPRLGGDEEERGEAAAEARSEAGTEDFEVI